MRACSRPAAAAALLLLVASCCGGGADAYTDPNEVMKLLALRTEMLARGMGPYIRTWECPHGPTRCNPCGSRSGADDSWGYLNGGSGWQHIACRTYDMVGSGEFAGVWRTGMNVSRMGVVTNIHLTDIGIEGTLESLGPVLCPFSHLRELDLDGSHLTGPIPRWIADCFPHLHELDLSFGRLSGTIPAWVPVMGGHLEQFKVEHNNLVGALPAGMGSMPHLRVLWAHHNGLSGSLPADLARSSSLISIDVRANPRLCGLLPPGLHTVAVPKGPWEGFCAKAYTEDDSACSVLTSPGTALGKPCG